MSRLREFLIKVPAACGAPNAAAWGKLNELAFDHELANKGSVFAKVDGVDLHDRLLPAVAFQAADGVDFDAAYFALGLLKVTSLAHDGKTEEAKVIAEELNSDASDFPAITALYTVEEALQGQWA